MSHHPPQILLIEDDLSLRDSLCQFLADQGYRVRGAATASAGWEALRAAPPQVCLLDMNLPDGSGLDVLHRLSTAGLPVRVIVMTAFHLQQMQSGDYNGILAGWLTKPVNPVDLVGRIEQLLAAPAQGGPAGQARGFGKAPCSSTTPHPAQ